MTTFALAFRHNVESRVSEVIARVTGAPVHVALIFGDRAVEATSRTGVHALNTVDLLASGQWTVVPVPQGSAAAAYGFAFSKVGADYDHVGVLLSWWLGRPARRFSTRRWFCSELAAGALMAAGIPLQPNRANAYTPRKLWDTVATWRP